MADPGRFAIAKLGSSNYSTWKFQMEMFLTREELWNVVVEEIPQVRTEVWNKSNTKARATIGLCIEQSQYPIIKDCTTAKDVWDALRNYHEKSTVTSQLSLLSKLCDAKVGESGDVEKHLLEMDVLFGRLESTDLELPEKLKIAMVLSSMPESYHFLASALEARPDKDVTMELVRSKLGEEYRKLLERSGNHSGEKQSLKAKQRVCFQCGKAGHFKANCPVFLAQKKRKEGEYSGGKPGRKGEAKQATESKSDTLSSALSFSAWDAGEVACTVVKKNRSWTIDSGASCHMTCSENFFGQLEKSSSVSVMMADGNSSKSGRSGAGTVRSINGKGEVVDIDLNNVLYVPDLEGGLLSVSRIADKGFNVLFKRQSVEIVSDAGDVVALGERSGGLYVLKEVEDVALSVNHQHTENCQHTWHRRFGHRDPAVLDRIGDLATGVKIVKCGASIVC